MKRVTTLGMALCLALAGGAASAATLDTTTATPNDGILNFTGVDWNSNGTGYVQGFDLTSANTIGDSDTFTFTFQAFAGAILGGSPTPNLYVASPGPAVGSYELTTISTITSTPNRSRHLRRMVCTTVLIIATRVPTIMEASAGTPSACRTK